MLREDVKNLSLILAFVTASLFTYGLTFHQGYLRYWGLEESMFSLSFERTLFQGFVASTYLGARTLVPVLCISIASFAMVLFFGWVAKKARLKKWFERRRKASSMASMGTDRIPIRLKYSGLFVVFSYWALTLFLVLQFILVVAGYLGKEAAKDQHSRFASGKEPPLLVVLKDKGSLNAHAIVCSGSHCAFLVNTQVKVFPLSDISSIEGKPGGA